MIIDTEILDLIQRPDSDNESESITQDTFLHWTNNEIIT